jgi:hypothetical protein
MFKKISTAIMLSFAVTSISALVLTSNPTNLISALAGDNANVTTVRGTDGADISTLTASNSYFSQMVVNTPKTMTIDTAQVVIPQGTTVTAINNKPLETNALILKPEPIANPTTVAAVTFGSQTQDVILSQPAKVVVEVNPIYNNKTVTVVANEVIPNPTNLSQVTDQNGTSKTQFLVANNEVEFYTTKPDTYLVNVSTPITTDSINSKGEKVSMITDANSVSMLLADVITDTTIDTDGDGIPDATDPYPTTECLPKSNAATCDLDKDGIPNSVDTDDDGDGSNDSVEIGDVNGDGIMDDLQIKVVTLLDSKGQSKTILFDGEGDCGKPLNVYSVKGSQLKARKNNFFDDSDFIGFKVKCSGTTTVTNLYPGLEKFEIGKMIKAGNTIPGDNSSFDYYEFPKYDVQINGHYGYQYYLTDGEKGDDTAKDGMIEDPNLNAHLLQIVSIVKAFVNPVTTYDENTDLSYTITITNKGTNPVLGIKITDDLFGGDPNIQVTACDKAFVSPNFSTIDLKLRRELQNTNDVYVITCKAKALKAGTKPIKNTVKLALDESYFQTVAPESPLKQSDGKSSTMEEAAEDSIFATPTPIVVPPPVVVDPPIVIPPIPTPTPTPIPQPSTCCNSGCCANGYGSINSVNNKNIFEIKGNASGYIPDYNFNNLFNSNMNGTGGAVVWNFSPKTNNFY